MKAQRAINVFGQFSPKARKDITPQDFFILTMGLTQINTDLRRLTKIKGSSKQ